METITVYKEANAKEKFELDIEDVNNCYLKGYDDYNNIPNYLGIWTDKLGIKAIKMRNERMLWIDVFSDESVYTRADIENFMKNNNNVQIISKESFRKEVDRIIVILKEVE